MPEEIILAISCFNCDVWQETRLRSGFGQYVKSVSIRVPIRRLDQLGCLPRVFHVRSSRTASCDVMCSLNIFAKY